MKNKSQSLGQKSIKLQKYFQKGKWLIFTILLFIIVSNTYAAEEFFENQLVKTSHTYIFYDNVEKKYLPLESVWNYSFTQGPSVDISRSSGDPMVVTSDPISFGKCPNAITTDGLLGLPFTAQFNSLMDLGVWTVTIDGYWTDPDTCIPWPPDPCNILCEKDISNRFRAEIHITVYNYPPEASLSYSPSRPTWNSRVTLHSNAHDPDGGSLVYRWWIKEKPEHSDAVIRGTDLSDPTISFSSDDDIGYWEFELSVDDDEGEMKKFYVDFTVPNVRPDISITGATDINALEDPFDLTVTPTTDVDGGEFDIVWDIVRSPHGPETNFQTGHHLLEPTTDADIGTWIFRATATDNEGDSDPADINVEVNDIPPDVNIVGETDIDALEDINLSASRLDDLDGGPELRFRWEIIDYPSTSTINFNEIPMDNSSLIIPTTGTECGEWEIQLTSSDNEGEKDDVDIVIVTVHNIMPDISVTGDTDLNIFDTIHFEVSPTEDPDGGQLEINWEIVQSPDASGYDPGSQIKTDSILDIATNSDFAGTWIIDVHVFDDEDFEQGEYHQRLKILVDEEPQAHISGPNIKSFLEPITLDASASIDPDTHNPHTNIEGLPDLSPGIVYYDWWVIEVPYDFYGSYFPGPIDEINLDLTNGLKTLAIPPGTFKTGSWMLELTVTDGDSDTDGEGNTDSKFHSLEIIDPDSEPIALIFPPAAVYYTDINGNLNSDIFLDGCPSFDPDNLLYEPYSLKLGISYFRWSDLLRPPLCTLSTELGEGPDFCLTPLFTRDRSIIIPECQGLWLIGLEVEDDENPANFGYSSAVVMIGNCDEHLCIDYPTTINYAYVEFTDQTDITIYYHIDSLLYKNPLFNDGLRLELSIFHEDDPITPVYNNHFDYDLLPTDKGGFLTFHWHGYTLSGERPLPGKYTIYITASSPLFPDPVYEAVEPDAIWIEIADVEILADSDTLLSISNAKDQIDYLHIEYDAIGHLEPTDIYDGAVLIIREESTEAEVYKENIPTGGEFNWNGIISPPDVYIFPGTYTYEVEVFKQGGSLGVSPKQRFIAYLIDLDLTGITDEDEEEPGVVLGIEETINAQLQLLPDQSALSGDVSFEIMTGMGAIEVSESGTSIALDGRTSYTAADILSPRTLTIEGVACKYEPTKLRVRFEPVGSTLEKNAYDTIVVNIAGLDLDVDSDNNGQINEADEAVEEVSPGMVCWINADYDDVEDDLAELQINFYPETLSGFLVLNAPIGIENIKLWKEIEKNEEVPFGYKYAIGIDPIPEVLYIEGIDEGEVHLKLEYQDDIGTIIYEDEVYLTVINIDLDVDTDRDSEVNEDDEDGEDNWRGAAGAIIFHNNDDDNEDGLLDKETNTIDENDESDLEKLVIRQLNIDELPPNWRLVLSVDLADYIRIFDDSSNEVISPSSTVTYDIPDATRGDLNYLMEALSYPDAGFSGLFTISLTLHNTVGPVYKDSVEVSVAPFLLTNNLDPAKILYVVRVSTDPSSIAFVSALEPIVNSIPGLTLEKIEANPNYCISGECDIWIQDEIEIGYTMLPPARSVNVVLDSIRDSGLKEYPKDKLLGPDFGYITVGTPPAKFTYDYFGNLECSPPVIVETPEGTINYCLGRIIYGGNKPFPNNHPDNMQMDAKVRDFLAAQEVQKPIEIEVGWLHVGHIDEIITFIPFPNANMNRGDKPFKLLLASPGLAISILNDQPDLTMEIPKLGIRIEDIIGDQVLINFNYFCQDQLNYVRLRLVQELRLIDPDDIIEVPVLFNEIFDRGDALALFPNLVNLICVNGHLIISEPHFDPFKEIFNIRLEEIGFVPPSNPSPNIHYINDWDVYHTGAGEIHCGTNVLRTPGSANKWWERYY